MKLSVTDFAAAYCRINRRPYGVVSIAELIKASVPGVQLDTDTLPERATITVRQRPDGSFAS